MADDDDENRDDNCNSSSTPSSAEAGSWGAWGAWGQGWIDTVKQKSAKTMRMVKKDLNEFVEVIQGDTSVAMSETASKIKEDEEIEDVHVECQKEEPNYGSIQSATKVVKSGVANFLQSVSDLMAVPPDDSKEEIITVSDFPSSSTHYNRRQEKLHALQVDPGTYCNEPEGLFNEWLEVFNLDDNKLDMSNMLVQNPAVRAIYTQLVPAVVSHTMFWQRYYYQVFLLDAEEKKRQDIVARANNELNDDDESGWGDDDDDDDGIEVLTSSLTSKLVMDFSMINTDIESDKVNPIETSDEILTIVDNTELNTITQVVVTEKSEIGDIITVEPPNIASDEDKETALKCNEPEKSCGQIDDTSPQIDHLECKQFETSKKVENLSEGQMLEISSDIIDISCNVETESDNETIRGNIDEVTPRESHAASPHNQLISQEHSETSSLSSWMSIDDVIKVKKITGEQEVKSDTNGTSANISTDSNGVIINKSDIIDESDEDFDLDIEDDVNEEEVAKMVEEIKNMAHGGTLEEDDDWENWE